jgi:hypothetical protein
MTERVAIDHDSDETLIHRPNYGDQLNLAVTSVTLATYMRIVLVIRRAASTAP